MARRGRRKASEKLRRESFWRKGGLKKGGGEEGGTGQTAQLFMAN